MPSRTSDFSCALAGRVLIALVFAPWWEYGPPDPAPFAPGWTAYAPVEVVGIRAWDGALGAALLWVVTGGLAASLVAVGPRRADGLAYLRPAVAALIAGCAAAGLRRT